MGYFTAAKRGEIKEANSEASFGDIARLVSDEWKKLGDSGKAQWEEKAKKDKVRYQNEMKDYSPPSSDDDDSGDDKAKKPKRAKKDPNAPKRPMNAYMLYANSVRAQIRKDNPELSIGDTSKEISARYKKISADEKAELEVQVAKAKEKYKKEMAVYEITEPKETKKSKSKGKSVESKKKKNKPEPEPESSESEESDDSDDSDSDSDSD